MVRDPAYDWAAAAEAGLFDLALELREKFREAHPGDEPTANQMRALVLKAAPRRGIDREVVARWYGKYDERGMRTE